MVKAILIICLPYIASQLLTLLFIIALYLIQAYRIKRKHRTNN